MALQSETYPSLLIISSADPTVGPGRVGLDYYNAFKSCNKEVDLLTLYSVKGRPDIISVYRRPSKIRFLFNKIRYFFTGLRKERAGYCFFYTYESMPQVPVKRVLSLINKEYDAVLIFFWQGMLSFATIEGIFEKLHCQIHFMGVDYSQMSGGCHFTRDCHRFEVGCGKCPGIYSNRERDFTFHNVRYRQDIYNRIKPIVHGNLYMRKSYYERSFLLKNARVEPSHDIFDMEEYYPMDKSFLRDKYRIPGGKKFILFFGCQGLSDKRKGMNYLLESLSLFWKSITQIHRDELLLLIAGSDIEAIKERIQFDYLFVGFVPLAQMPELYSLSDVFLSPSIDDAGPTMVNQALCCGTPVVAFEMGAALESVKDKGTGYCAKLKDCVDFARGIDFIYNLSKKDYDNMSKLCREVAFKHTSFEAHVNDFLRIYKKYL